MLLALLLYALLFLSSAQARTTAPALDPRWMVDHWTVADGLPIGHFTGAARTPDGMLWLASYDGLIRFDGHEFTTLRPVDLPGLSSSRLEAITADAEGRLWLVTEQRDVVRVEGGAAKTWSAASLPSPPQDVVQVGRQLWVRCEQDLMRVVDGAPVAFGAPRASDDSLGLLQDFAVGRDSSVWLGYERALLHLDAAGQLLGRYGVEEGLAGANLTSVVLDAAGVPTLTDLDGVLRLDGGRFARLPIEGEVPSGGVCAVVPEEDGALVILGATGTWRREPDGQTRLLEARTPRTCLDGSARRSGGRWQAGESSVTLDGVEILHTGGTARAVLPDGDNAWVITIGNGLYLLRPAEVGRMVWQDDAPGGVLATASGERVAILQRALVRFDHGVRPVTIFDAAGEAISGVVWQDTAAVDARGRVWFGGRGGLCELRGEACRMLAVPWRDPRPLVVDGAGALWLDTAAGLGRTPAGEGPEEGWELVEAHGPAAGVRLAARLLDGTVVVAVEHQGLRHYAGDRVDAWTRADAMGLDLARDLVVDSDGLLWIATVDGGLCRLDLRGPDPPVKPAPTCLNSRQGLPVDTLHSVSFDHQGRIWMSSNHGIFYVKRAEVEAAMAGEAALSPLMFTERDGMPHREANGTAWPTVGRAPDGRLYYPTQLGIAVVDPTEIAALAPPAVRVESMSVGGDPTSWGDARSLSSEQRDVAFTWTAPEFRWPEQLKFRYRLKGYDDAWSALGTERQAAWTNLPPGDYAFEVEAALGGAWSRAPARVAFSRAPAFVETVWFPVSIGAVALGLAGLVVGIRARSRRARIRALEEEVQRRTAVLAERNADLASRNAVIAAQAERLAELDSLKSAFVSNLSHELRTPLTLVLGPLEELRDAPEGLDARRRAAVAIAHRNAERLRELIQQLFDAARLQTGGLPLRARRQDLGAFVRHVVGRFASAAAERGLALDVSAPDGVVLWFDPDLIDKVLTNLIGNALKFTPAAGRVTVALRDDPVLDGADGAATVSVTDTGVGIPATEQASIFERFYQVDSADRRQHGGAGIGLSLARELVELHGGALTVDSAPGRGSAFCFTLPLGATHLRPDELDLSPAAAPPPVASGTEAGGLDEDAAAGDDDGGAEPGALVLVVEDHPDLRAYIAAHLGQHFQVQTAPDGAAALDAIRAQRPDLVVSDVMMPRLDGISMCRALRADPALADLPVILVSAKGAEADRLAGLQVAQAWFSKPFRMREMVETALRLAPASPKRAADADGAPLPPEAMTDEDRRLIARLDGLVRERLADPELSVVLLAKRLAFSRRQLLREVRRLTGQPVVAYVQRVRMEAARDMLRRDRAATVSEVAAAVGMNRAYFSRLYSAWHGKAPSEDREAG